MRSLFRVNVGANHRDRLSYTLRFTNGTCRCRRYPGCQPSLPSAHAYGKGTGSRCLFVSATVDGWRLLRACPLDRLPHRPRPQTPRRSSLPEPPPTAAPSHIFRPRRASQPASQPAGRPLCPAPAGRALRAVSAAYPDDRGVARRACAAGRVSRGAPRGRQHFGHSPRATRLWRRAGHQARRKRAGLSHRDWRFTGAAARDSALRPHLCAGWCHRAASPFTRVRHVIGTPIVLTEGTMENSLHVPLTGAVSINASTTIGAYRALEISQLIHTTPTTIGHHNVGALANRVAPRFPWRGLMIDTSRRAHEPTATEPMFAH